MPPVERKLIPSLVTKEAAKEIICSSLYDQFEKSLLTSHIAISIKGATQHAFGHSTHTNMVHLSRVDKPVADFFPFNYELAEVKVEYKLEFLSPDTLMTRADFVMELSEIWESMYNTLQPQTRSTAGTRFTEAQELLHSTYQARELANIDYLMTQQLEAGK